MNLETLAMIKIKADPDSLREDLPHVLSLGAGTQSSTLALLCARGLVKPMPVAAIFADVKAEPQSVYNWLDGLEKELPFPVHRVTQKKGLIAAEESFSVNKTTGKRYWNQRMPFYTQGIDGKREGMAKRFCTSDFKVDPIIREIKKIIGVRRGGQELLAVQWIGLSCDELQRMRDSRVKYIKNRWPLLELGMSRQDCLDWMKSNGFDQPPRSACFFCPYHSNKEWQRLKDEEPEEFEKAVKFEKETQARAAECETFQSKPFLHRSLTSIDEIDFTNPDPDQEKFGFAMECEGLCGN